MALGLGLYLDRHRRAQQLPTRPQTISQRPLQVQHRGSGQQQRPEARFGRPVAQQQVQVREITQPMAEIVVVEQVGHAVQRHVGRTQRLQASATRQRIGLRQQQGRVGRLAHGQRQDVVVHVQRRPASHMLHRWQLVHPLAVIALVVGIVVCAEPAAQHQSALDSLQRALRHQDVDVGEQTPLHRRQAGQHIGSPLEQHDRNVQVGQGLGDQTRLAPHLGLLGPRHLQGRHQVLAGAARHGLQLARIGQTCCQPGQHIGAARLVDDRLPLRR